MGSKLYRILTVVNTNSSNTRLNFFIEVKLRTIFRHLRL